MLKKLKTRSEGFTIIEIMIVLAIAALILLIVLLAVPALQRNSRNTSMKNDASAVAAAVSEYESNNNGTPPAFVSTDAKGTVTVCDASPCTSTSATAKVQGGTKVSHSTNQPGSPLTDVGIGNIVVYLGSRCDNTGNTRAVAIVYDVETSGSPAPKCIDS